jgi:anti-sigma regulatory factor (Ser/Thr protein kinase)
VLRSSVEVTVQDVSQIGDARRKVLRLAQAAGVDEAGTGNAAIVATEMATNLINHGRGGCVLVRAEAGAVEIHAIDKGAGMDLARSLRDGQSTRGTAGNGLGAIRRLSVAFDAYSDARGSVVWARVGAAATGRIEVGAVCLPLAGEDLCGDDWICGISAAGAYLLLVDGLGHGPLAASAAQAATAQAQDQAPVQALQAAHRHMAGTRGGAGAYARLDCIQRTLSYASVGNISLQLITHSRARGLPAQNGTLGMNLPPRLQESAVALDDPSLLVAHSDGVATRWSLADYPGLASRHPAVVAGVLWRDFRRGRDDATIVVLRC